MSPNGKTLISVSSDGSARIWDISNERGGGKEVKVIKEEGSNPDWKGYCIYSVTIPTDSTYFCTGGGDELHKTTGIHVYDMTKGDYKVCSSLNKALQTTPTATNPPPLPPTPTPPTSLPPYTQLLTKLEGHICDIHCLTSSSDGKMLFSGSGVGGDKTVKIWDTSSQNADQWTLLKTLVGHTSPVRDLSLSLCSRYLATGSDDKTIKVWSVEVGALLRTIKSPQMTEVKGVIYKHNDTISSASTNGKVRAWNLGAKAQDPLKLEGHTKQVIAVAISGDGSTVISGSRADSAGSRANLRVWDAQTGEQKALVNGDTFCVSAVDISKDGKLAVQPQFRINDNSAIGQPPSVDHTVIIWSLEDEAKELKKINFGNFVGAVTFAPNEESLFAGGGDHDGEGLSKQYSVSNGELIKEFKGHTKIVRSLKTTTDGEHLVSASNDNKIIVWNVKSGEKVLTLEGHTDKIHSVDLTLDNSKIVSASEDKTAKLWDFKTGELLHTFEGHSYSVTSVAVHPSGNFIATGSFDETWKLGR